MEQFILREILWRQNRLKELIDQKPTMFGNSSFKKLHGAELNEFISLEEDMQIYKTRLRNYLGFARYMMFVLFPVQYYKNNLLK